MYPTWQRVDAKHWQSVEGWPSSAASGWTPDYEATRERDGWRLKMRTSAKAVRGFRRMSEVKDYVAAIQR